MYSVVFAYGGGVFALNILCLKCEGTERERGKQECFAVHCQPVYVPFFIYKGMLVKDKRK